MANDEEQLASQDIADVERLVRAKARHRRLLLSKPGVIGMDIGYRVRKGQPTDERVVKVYVSQKLDKDELAADDLVPTTLRIDDQEVTVDVEESTIPHPAAFTRRSRPLRGGSSIGPSNQQIFGTLGIGLTRNNNRAYILSCDHVIGISNFQAAGPIVQPSLADGGDAATDVVADLSNFIALDFGFTTITIFGITITIPNRNFADAAIAQVRQNAPFDNGYNVANREIHWLGYPKLTRALRWTFQKESSLLNRRVCKMGRTTEFTVGKIDSLWRDTFVGPYPNGQNAWFEDQIVIAGEGPFAGAFLEAGDSGSLLLDFDTSEPIGLLFAAVNGGSTALANRLDRVMSGLSIPQL
jgi:hypothetical protein